MERGVPEGRRSFAQHLHQLVGDASASQALDHRQCNRTLVVDSGHGDQTSLVHHAESHHLRCAESLDQLGERPTSASGAVADAASFGAQLSEEDTEGAAQTRVVHGDDEELVGEHL